MKKLVFAGGYVHKSADKGKAFCEELVEDREGEVRILVCLFARLPETWQELFQKDVAFFTNHLPNTKMHIELAAHDTFLEQVRIADVIYLRGGSSQELVTALKEQKGWEDLLEGKTIAGTSAGADALSRYYYNLHDLTLQEGCDIAQVKVIPHFDSDYHGWEFDWQKAVQELDDYKEKLPVLALREGEFQVLKLD